MYIYVYMGPLRYCRPGDAMSGFSLQWLWSGKYFHVASYVVLTQLGLGIELLSSTDNGKECGLCLSSDSGSANHYMYYDLGQVNLYLSFIFLSI